jgi:hypothetical protein
MSVSRIVNLACAVLFLVGSLVFAWTSVTDHNAAWAGLLALGCFLLIGFTLLEFGSVVVDPDNWTDR